MAYDPKLADRLRRLLAGRRGVAEKAMFGGLAFLLDGKMFVGILRDELLARVGPEGHDAALARPHVRVMDFTGRPMRGYVFVGPAAIARDAELERWVTRCEAHAATLPAKAKKATRAKRPLPGPSPSARAGGERGATRRAGRRPARRAASPRARG